MSATSPTLSVLMPHYNDPEGVELSLRSVASQTFAGTREIIIYDDGSSPEHVEALHRVTAEALDPVRVILGAANRGRPYARNVLLDAATGAYSAWLDAGDEWYPEKTALQLDAVYRARHKQFDRPVWVTCNYDWQWEGGKPRRRKQAVDGDQLTNLVVGSLAAYLWTTFAPTEHYRMVGYFDLDLPRLQDLDFFLRFVEKGGMFMLPGTHDPLCVYHKSDVGRDGEQVLRCFEYIFQKHAPVMARHSRRFRRNRELHMYMHAARFTQNNGDRLKTAAFLARGAAANPIGFARRMWKTKGVL